MMRKAIQMEPVGAVPPLRGRTKKDRSLYARRPDIEELLLQLSDAGIDEIARRSEIQDQQDPQYLPPEVLVHYLRRSKDVDDPMPYEAIFRSLRLRLLQRLPVQSRTRSGDRVIEDRYQADVRDAVLDRVLEILCSDRQDYDVRLDYYEVNFNGAVAKARFTAKRDLSERKKRENSHSLEAKRDSDGAADFDSTIRALRGIPEDFSDVDYRSEVLSAINNLPKNEREVILMLVEGFTIKEISEAIGCTAKTVSARRDRARKQLAVEMNGRPSDDQ